MNEKDLRDCFAMMLTVGFAMKGEINPKAIWEIADMIIEARESKETLGLPAIKRKARAK
jgi:hypothetical protein